jgi:SpoVK/Ycf46/Vps4 family AAA+-type ATPase
VIAEERTKQHHVLADALTDALRQSTQSLPMTNGLAAKTLFFESVPKKTFSDLVLPDHIRHTCQSLVEEQHRRELLRSYNLEPRHRILVVGPPGTGKTSLAEAFANALMIPFITVRYEALIGSYLGETASRLKSLFDQVRTHNCVLFFDEFDTIGKERGDAHETGEIKRVVSSLLLQIDSLPSHVVVFTATNHPELLDRAVWRRFQLRLYLPMPTKEQLVYMLQLAEAELGIRFGAKLDAAVSVLNGASFAEFTDFVTDLKRGLVLEQGEYRGTSIIDEMLDERRDWHVSRRTSGDR